MTPSNPIRTGKPSWLRRKLPSGPEYEQIRSMIGKSQLHTVCQEANCPNQFECFSARTATFLILGSTCTRNCRFCNIGDGLPGLLDPDEPRRVADAADKMNLRYVVVTSVTRDDLEDGGADHFAATIHTLREKIPGVQVEVLIPDFQGEKSALETVLAARPDVLNHNMETVRRLYPTVRPQADYDRSLELLARVKTIDWSIPAKSGIMLGLGETEEEVRQTIADVYRTGCHMLTIGQYLQPTPQHLPVVDFIPPEEFERWRRFALEVGFEKVASGPFVRSSYHAGEMFMGSE
ncbi:lipoyl synthase [uncultured Desulfosarcina sp.]|uniref:lipoyl synthase n=1 Tax=uncultured Desulfosarcina sp. TaxID=218289 RepID=UPI0029C70E54|nr:lipoyl synthase [uncultured Desulfosarcina sp.]